MERRWAIYSSGYVARLVEALENDYPAIRRILGEVPFGSLTARYVRRFPPRSFDIGRAGERLSTFLEDDPLASELRFLPDLARYEWSLAEAFVSADSVPLAWSELAALGPEAVADATFRLRPGATLIRSSWPLLELWGAKDLADEDHGWHGVAARADEFDRPAAPAGGRGRQPSRAPRAEGHRD